MMNVEVSTVFIIDSKHENRMVYDSLLGAVGIETEAYGSAEEFLDNFNPDSHSNRQGCVLVDVSLPGMTGFELQANLKANEIDLPVIFLTDEADIPQCVQAMKAGAVDVLEKSCRDINLLQSIGEALDQHEHSQRKNLRQDTLKQRLSQLTQREREVLSLLVNEEPTMSSEQIAGRLFISRRTVEHHRAAIKEKMYARSLLELVGMARICNFHV
jgi:FixJ family two-component response regulator